MTHAHAQFCPCWGARLPYNSIDDDEDDDQDFVGGKGGYKGGCRHRYRQQQEQEQRPRQQPPGGQQPVGRPSPASYNTTVRRSLLESARNEKELTGVTHLVSHTASDGAGLPGNERQR